MSKIDYVDQKCHPDTLKRYASYYSGYGTTNSSSATHCNSCIENVKVFPNPGTMSMWRITKIDKKSGEETHKGYIYGCFHGKYLMTEKQFGCMRTSGCLMLEHDYYSMSDVEQRHIRTTYPGLSDELILNREYYRTYRQTVSLDYFHQFPLEEYLYTSCVKRHAVELEKKHSEMVDLINNGTYTLSHMADTDENLYPDMERFLRIREKEWIPKILDNLEEKTVTIVVGLGHIYSLIKCLQENGYSIFEVLKIEF